MHRRLGLRAAEHRAARRREVAPVDIAGGETLAIIAMTRRLNFFLGSPQLGRGLSEAAEKLDERNFGLLLEDLWAALQASQESKQDLVTFYL
jgi:hypothetical protein